jgi:hypothetical protein
MLSFGEYCLILPGFGTKKRYPLSGYTILTTVTDGTDKSLGPTPSKKSIPALSLGPVKSLKIRIAHAFLKLD